MLVPGGGVWYDYNPKKRDCKRDEQVEVRENETAASVSQCTDHGEGGAPGETGASLDLWGVVKEPAGAAGKRLADRCICRQRLYGDRIL